MHYIPLLRRRDGMCMKFSLRLTSTKSAKITSPAWNVGELGNKVIFIWIMTGPHDC